MTTKYTQIPPISGTGGVTSLNSETGAITLVAGSNITVTPAGQNITIASTGGGSAPGGNIHDVQLNNGSGGFAGSDNLNFQDYLTINGDSGYGQLQWLNTPASAGYGGAGINGTATPIIVGALNGDLSIWSSQAMNFSSDTGGTNMLQLNTDGGITVAAPTGGSKGLGTINATGLYVNGVAVGGGTPGGSNLQMQFNDSGSFGGATAVVYDKSSGDFGAGINSTGVINLTHPFQVGGGNSYLPPTSISGAITYYVPPAAPASGSATITYQQLIPDPVAPFTAVQVDGAGAYIADGTVSITYYVAAYVTVDGTKIYSPGLANVVFTDNSDTANFSVQLDWVAVTGATGYELWANGSYNGNTYSFVSQDVGNVITFLDDGSLWTSVVAHPPVHQNLGYLASGQTITYDVYDYVTAAGVNLYSTTNRQIISTDDHRSQHPPAGLATSLTTGTYYSNDNDTHTYQVWSQYVDGGYSSTSSSISRTVPNTTLATPSFLIAIQNNAETGYTANGYSSIYAVVAYKNTPAGYIFSNSATSAFMDDNSGLPYGVDLSWGVVAGADGYLIYINGGEFTLIYNSQDVGNVLAFADQNTGWVLSFPLNLNSLGQPTSFTSVQNDAETGYTADGTNIFTYNIAAYWNTPLGKVYSAPSAVFSNFTDNSDLSTFGVDLAWNPAGGDPSGIAPAGYELWVVGGIHPLNTAQDVGNVTSFADQNTSWATLDYQPLGSGAYTFYYGVHLSWSAVAGATNYYVVKTAGDVGPSYPIFLNTASITQNDTDDSVWTAGATTSPTPVELDTYYDIHASWASVGGGPTYRILRDVAGGGFTTSYDTASTSFIDGNYSFSWVGAQTITNTLYHATGATRTVKAYSYDNADAIYSIAHADNSVTDNNSGNYYSILWTASNYPSGADKLKLIINTSNGELLTNPTLTYTDTNGSIAYNSNTTVTPNTVDTHFYSNQTGDVNVATLTAETTVITPQIGSGVGLVQLGSSSVSSGSNSISIGPSSNSTGINGIAIGNGANASSGTDNIAIGTSSRSSSTHGTAVGIGSFAEDGGVSIGYSSHGGNGGVGIGAAASSGVAGIAIGELASSLGNNFGAAIGYFSAATSFKATALGYNATATNTSAIAIGTMALATGQNAIAIGEGCSASGTFSTAIGFSATATTASSTAIGFGANVSASGGNAFALGNSVTNSEDNSLHVGITNQHKIIINPVDYFMIRPRGGAQEKILGDLDTVIFMDEVLTFQDSVVYY